MRTNDKQNQCYQWFMLSQQHGKNHKEQMQTIQEDLGHKDLWFKCHQKGLYFKPHGAFFSLKL